MCHVYYPVASVLIHSCLFLVESDCKDQSTTRGRQDSGLACASWAAKKFHQGLELFKVRSNKGAIPLFLIKFKGYS